MYDGTSQPPIPSLWYNNKRRVFLEGAMRPFDIKSILNLPTSPVSCSHLIYLHLYVQSPPYLANSPVAVEYY